MPSPKTASKGKPYRVIPMFPLLKPYFEETGFEPEYANPFKAMTYGDPDKGAGAKSGALGGNPRDLPPQIGGYLGHSDRPAAASDSGRVGTGAIRGTHYVSGGQRRGHMCHQNCDHKAVSSGNNVLSSTVQSSASHRLDFRPRGNAAIFPFLYPSHRCEDWSVGRKNWRDLLCCSSEISILFLGWASGISAAYENLLSGPARIPAEIGLCEGNQPGVLRTPVPQ